MKLKLFLLASFVGQIAFAQTSTESSITNKNYYDYFQNIQGHSINWLRTTDAVPIIIDELLKKGVAYYTINVGQLLKFNDSTRLVVTVSFEKGGKEYGFLYEASHGIPINLKDREFLTNKTKRYYVQAEKDVTNGVDFMRIDPLPDNVLLLRQRCYWFQFDKNGTKYNVSKEVAQSILRQDIDDYVEKL